MAKFSNTRKRKIRESISTIQVAARYKLQEVSYGSKTNDPWLAKRLEKEQLRKAGGG